jgi:predicted nucleic acid-binding protein
LILVDAGPLVALVNADDQYHSRCVAALETFREPMATVWPPLSEAVYFLADLPKAQEALSELLERGALQLLALDAGDAPRIRELMRKQANRPMDLADAALLRVAECEGIRKIFTVDRPRFFRISAARPDQANNSPLTYRSEILWLTIEHPPPSPCF